MKQDFKCKRTVYSGSFCFNNACKTFYCISREVNTYSLPKLKKISFVLIFFSLHLVQERIYLETSRKNTSMYICAPVIIDQKVTENLGKIEPP